MLLLSILIMHPPPRPTLFPYTTLFRSMVVEPNANVVFLHQLFDGVDGFNRLGGNAVEAEFPGELKYFPRACLVLRDANEDRKSTRLNSSHRCISYAVFCLKKKKIL